MENLLLSYLMDDIYVFQSKKAGEEFDTTLQSFVNLVEVFPNRRHLPSFTFSLCGMHTLLWWKHMKKNPG